MEELLNFICGKKLGSGAYRDVYEFIPDKTLVIKIANSDDGRGVNLLEKRLWFEIEETPMQKWFAPVIDVSGSGKYLLQKRIEPMPKDKYPNKVPAFFTDMKYTNFGYLKGKGFVCCDLGSFNFWKSSSRKIVKANWWEV